MSNLISKLQIRDNMKGQVINRPSDVKLDVPRTRSHNADFAIVFVRSCADVICLCLFMLALSGVVSADEAVVVRAARLLDVESGEILAPAVVVIDGERIAAVNPAEIPPGAQVVDLGDRTLLPGLIDLHTHLVWDLERYCK